jgi:hypothetical protein
MTLRIYSPDDRKAMDAAMGELYQDHDFAGPPPPPVPDPARSQADRVALMTQRYPRFAIDHPGDAVHLPLEEHVCRRGAPNLRNGSNPSWLRSAHVVEGVTEDVESGLPVYVEFADDADEVETIVDEIAADRAAYCELWHKEHAA